VRFLVLDAVAFRAISGFNPGEITPEAFEKARAEERLALLMQNLGRAMRGEPGKTVVLFVLNPDKALKDAIEKSSALTDGAELPLVSASGKDLVCLVDQAGRWLAADGGEWPRLVPGAASSIQLGRPKGAGKRTKDEVLVAAQAALERGTNWSDFRRSEHPQRSLSVDELNELKARFECRVKEPG
jgi:hypothetical protein